MHFSCLLVVLSRKGENLIQQLRNDLKKQEVCVVNLKVSMPVRIHERVTRLLSDGFCGLVWLVFSFFFFFFIKNLGNYSLSASFTDTLLKEPWHCKSKQSKLRKY